MTKTKFTDQEMEIIQETVGFPDTYITTKEADTIETILKKPETINKQILCHPNQ